MNDFLKSFLKSLKKSKKYNYSEEDEKLLLQMSIGTIKKRIIAFKKKGGEKKNRQ